MDRYRSERRSHEGARRIFWISTDQKKISWGSEAESDRYRSERRAHEDVRRIFGSVPIRKRSYGELRQKVIDTDHKEDLRWMRQIIMIGTDPNDDLMWATEIFVGNGTNSNK